MGSAHVSKCNRRLYHLGMVGRKRSQKTHLRKYHDLLGTLRTSCACPHLLHLDPRVVGKISDLIRPRCTSSGATTRKKSTPDQTISTMTCIMEILMAGRIPQAWYPTLKTHLSAVVTIISRTPFFDMVSHARHLTTPDIHSDRIRIATEPKPSHQRCQTLSDLVEVVVALGYTTAIHMSATKGRASLFRSVARVLGEHYAERRRGLLVNASREWRNLAVPLQLVFIQDP